MTDAVIISDPGRQPIVVQRRENGVAIHAPRIVLALSGDEVNRLIEFVDSADVPAMTVTTPSTARFSNGN